MRSVPFPLTSKVSLKYCPFGFLCLLCPAKARAPKKQCQHAISRSLETQPKENKKKYVLQVPRSTESSLIASVSVLVVETSFSDRTAGFSERTTGFSEHTTGFSERITGFSELIAGFSERIAGFSERIAGFSERIAGFSERATGFSERTTGLSCCRDEENEFVAFFSGIYI